MHEIWVLVVPERVPLKLREALNERVRYFVEGLGQCDFSIGNKRVRIHVLNLSKESDYDLKFEVFLNTRSTPEKRRRLPSYAEDLSKIIKELLDGFKESQSIILRLGVTFSISEKIALESAIEVGDRPRTLGHGGQGEG